MSLASTDSDYIYNIDIRPKHEEALPTILYLSKDSKW